MTQHDIIVSSSSAVYSHNTHQHILFHLCDLFSEEGAQGTIKVTDYIDAAKRGETAPSGCQYLNCTLFSQEIAQLINQCWSTLMFLITIPNEL